MKGRLGLGGAVCTRARTRLARGLAPCLAACLITVVLVAGAGSALSPFDASRAWAQDSLIEKTLPGPRDPELGKSPERLDPDQPLLLQADELIYDNQRNKVTAVGNVEIYYKDYTLLADKVIYDQSANTLTAEGRVRIKEPGGAVVNAERITLTDDFREGFIRSLKIVTKGDSRIAAAEAIRKDENTTIFERGVFTPCKPCAKHPDRAPLWRVKAKRIIHRKDEKRIYYENATLDFFGMPVLWMPYFFHPDPTVKRRSGFLFPKLASSEDLGFTAEVPYYFALAPNYDFTFNPMYTSKQGVLWKGTWRHRLADGSYRVKFAAIDQNDPELDQPPNTRGWRGSIVTDGRFSLGSYWNWGWDVTLESDDTFRRFYKLDSTVRTDRISKVYMIGESERNYFSAYLYHFGGLLAADNSNSESRVHPIIDYNYVVADPVLGGELSFDANLLSLSRDDGVDSNRVVAEVRWRRQLIDGLGQVYTPFAHLRGDIYRVTNLVDPGTGLPRPEDVTTRGMATAGLQYEYPFIARTANAAHVIEPVAQVIARPDQPDLNAQQDVPNLDSRSLVFDDTLLFDIDKFSGYDRIETGVRANVGLRYTMQAFDGGYARLVLGRSYRLSDANPFAAGTGLETSASDYVAGLYFEPAKTFRMIAQTRFDDRDLRINRQDVQFTGSYGPFSATATYAFTRFNPVIGLNQNQQEINASGAVQITEYWSAFAGLRYDLVADQNLYRSAGLRYADECFVLSVSYNESFYTDRDIDPDRSVMLRFELKHLGGYSYKADLSSDLAASGDKS